MLYSHRQYNLTDMLSKFNFQSNIFNVNESGLTVVQKPGVILAPKGQRQIRAPTSNERGRTITICCCMSAADTYVPPLMIKTCLSARWT